MRSFSHEATAAETHFHVRSPAWSHSRSGPPVCGVPLLRVWERSAKVGSYSPARDSSHETERALTFSISNRADAQRHRDHHHELMQSHGREKIRRKPRSSLLLSDFPHHRQPWRTIPAASCKAYGAEESIVVVGTHHRTAGLSRQDLNICWPHPLQGSRILMLLQRVGGPTPGYYYVMSQPSWDVYGVV